MPARDYPQCLQRPGTLLHWFVVVVLPILEDLFSTVFTLYPCRQSIYHLLIAVVILVVVVVADIYCWYYSDGVDVFDVQVRGGSRGGAQESRPLSLILGKKGRKAEGKENQPPPHLP